MKDAESPNNYALLGIDVGYSATRPTTGIAWWDGSSLGAKRAHTDWPSRCGVVPLNLRPRVIAIDGPLVPSSSVAVVRGCESLFQKLPFQKRCKPGMSHFGTGLLLRDAAHATRAQFADSLCNIDPTNGSICRETSNRIVEAFPNAFLGVMLPDSVFDSIDVVRRGQRFDRLYDAARDCGVLERVVGLTNMRHSRLSRHLSLERDHELRAAWICLLTAAFAADGTATRVGDPIGGWFWLPPWALWAEWARIAIRERVREFHAAGRAMELIRKRVTNPV